MSTRWRLASTAAFALLLALVEGCAAPEPASKIRSAAAAQTGDARHRTEVDALLKIVTNPGLPADDRARAADRLGEIRAAEAAPRLIALLPGEYDTLTFSVVHALGRIGDAAALPKLREIEESRLRISGAIIAVTSSAIDALETGDPSHMELRDFPLFDLDRLHDQVCTLVRRHYPQATCRMLDDAIHFEHDARVFVVHEPLKSGVWQDPWKVRGPNRGGIVGDIRIQPGEYVGAAMVPQTFDKRYFKERLLAPYSPKLDAHLHVLVKYPSGDGEMFLNELTRLLNDFDRYASRSRTGTE